MPSALRKGLSAIFGVGKEVTAEATRRRSLSRISFDRDVFCVMSASAFFFSSRLADVALRLGPYMSISSQKDICTRTQ